MRFFLVVLVFDAACSRTSASESQPVARASSTPAAATATAPAPAVPTAPVDAGDASEEAAARRSCSDLTSAEKSALERCAISRFGVALGQRGAFTARIEVDEKGATRIRTENDIEHQFRAALPGDACARAGQLLAPVAPCTWDVRGPFPAWTITTVRTN